MWRASHAIRSLARTRPIPGDAGSSVPSWGELGRRWMGARAPPSVAAGTDWWADDSLEAAEVHAGLVKQMDTTGSPGLKALNHFLGMVRTPEEAKLALALTERFRWYHARAGRLEPLPPKAGALLIRACTNAGALDVAKEALKKQSHLGLAPGLKTIHLVMERFAEDGDVEGLLHAYSALLGIGHQPTAETAAVLVPALARCGEEAHATALLEEFAANGVEVGGEVQGAVAAVKEAAAVAAAEAAAAEAEAAAAEAEVEGAGAEGGAEGAAEDVGEGGKAE